MNLLLKRDYFSDTTTIGKLYVDGIFQCYTLEDKDRELENGKEKVYGETAIPRHTYQVIIDYSNRFKRELPLLKNVPDFEGIRIHPGNTHEDTHGCILVGSGTSGDKLFNSRVAFESLFKKMEDAYDRQEPISITIL